MFSTFCATGLDFLVWWRPSGLEYLLKGLTRQESIKVGCLLLLDQRGHVFYPPQSGFWNDWSGWQFRFKL